MQVPTGPAREVLDVLPLMMNRRDAFISGVSWAHAKSKFPSLSFDRFWWTKVGLYDKKNQEALNFWRNVDLTDRQSERMLFGSGSISRVLDDISDQDDVDYIYGRGNLGLDDEGNLRVPKSEPLELGERDFWRMYRARFLEGDLPMVPAGPVLWGSIVENQGLEGGEGLQVVVVDVAEFVESVAVELVDSVLEDVVAEMAGEVVCEVCFGEDAPNTWEYHRRGAA